MCYDGTDRPSHPWPSSGRPSRACNLYHDGELVFPQKAAYGAQRRGPVGPPARPGPRSSIRSKGIKSWTFHKPTHHLKAVSLRTHRGFAQRWMRWSSS